MIEVNVLIKTKITNTNIVDMFEISIFVIGSAKSICALPISTINKNNNKT